MTIAEKHSLDIPHVTAVELPLNVKNPDRAISMLGGKDRIASAINHRDKAGNANIHTPLENTLELKLREDDPFHHPIQSLFLSHERVLLKVLVPKLQLPENYKLMPLKELLSQTNYKATPVAIIDKTYSFKLIADFQVSTKHNPVAQEYATDFAHATHLDELRNYFHKHGQFTGLVDWKDPENFANIDHNLIPPPIFSQVRFPFDYKFQPSPGTHVVTDSVSGESKVVRTRVLPKLHSIIIEYGQPVPQEPAPVNRDHLLELRRLREERGTEFGTGDTIADAGLLNCIEWLDQVFQAKPIWLRKHLDDITPPHHKKYLKQSLPYVSYLLKSGPWRFCCIRYGVDPALDPSFWQYQTEYFRVPRHKQAVTREARKKTYDKCTKIQPPTIQKHALADSLGIKVTSSLLFDGHILPTTVNFQLGDLLDENVVALFKESGSSTLRDTPDASDGWLQRQTIETVRRLVRYKINQMVKDEPINESKVVQIINGDYLSNTGVDDDGDFTMADDTLADANDDDDANDDGANDDDDEELEDDEDEEEEADDTETSVKEEDVMRRLEKLAGKEAGRQLRGLVGYVKQDHLH